MVTPYPDDDPWQPAPGDAGRESADERICRMVVDRLLRAPELRDQLMTVSVQNRVVILDGVVDTPRTADEIREEAWATPGVVDVCNALVIPSDGYGHLS